MYRSTEYILTISGSSRENDGTPEPTWHGTLHSLRHGSYPARLASSASINKIKNYNNLLNPLNLEILVPLMVSEAGYHCHVIRRPHRPLIAVPD